jgi:tetratricopeptide (TPR) repeat protein
MATSYMGISDFERAAKIYQRLSDLNPKEAQYYVGLAQCYAKLGDKVDAIQAAKKAGEIDPKLKEEADKFIQSL